MSVIRRLLGEIASFDRTGISPENIQKGMLYVGLENVTGNGKFINVREIDSGEIASSKFVFDERHILYGKLRPYLKKIARPDFKGICSTDILPILAGKEVDKGYLYHYLRLPEMVDLATVRSSGINLPRISPKILAEFEIAFPPVPEQKRIAEVLDKADALREKRRLALQKLDALLQSVFLEMFGDPVKNPKGWGKVSLADCTERIIDCPHSTPIWQDDGIICLRTSNLLYGEWNWEDTRYINPDEYHARISRSSIETGDIILSREGTVGVAAIVEHNMKVCMGQRLVQVRPDEQKTISEYLLRLLLFELAPERIETFMVGSTSKHINVAQLRKLPIMLPPIELQKQFNSISQNIKKLKNSSMISFNYSNNLFQALQQRAFKGELFSVQSPTVESQEEKAWGQTSLF